MLEIRRRVFGPAHPATLRSAHWLAVTLQREGKFGEAEALYRAALESSPNDSNALSSLAWFLASVPDKRFLRPQEALHLSRKAVQLPPEEGRKYAVLGLAQYRNGLWKEAVASLTRAVEMNKGKNAENLFILAMACSKQGDSSAAERFFEKGVRGTGESEVESRMFWKEAAELLGKPGPPGRF